MIPTWKKWLELKNQNDRDIEIGNDLNANDYKLFRMIDCGHITN